MIRAHLGVIALLLLATSPARADETGDCIDANEKAIQQRKEHRLLEARTTNARCTAMSCPDDLRRICTERSDKLNAAIPSIVFDVKDGAGHDLTGVKVTVGGTATTTDPTVTALELDPGPYTFVFESAGQTSERSFVIREGERQRREPVVITTTAPAAPLPPATLHPAPPGTESSTRGNPLRTMSIVAGSAGIVGLAIGSVFGALASASWSSARGECPTSLECNRPRATSDRSTALGDATASTVAFIAGGALLATGVVLFLLPAKHEATALRVTASAGWGGAGFLLQGGF